MIYSNKQLRIFKEWEETSNNIAIEAAPGSGKSFTLLEILKRTLSLKKSIFLAFNKSIQLENQSKIPEGVESSTLHSLGFKVLLRNTNCKWKVNEIKNWVLGKKILELDFTDKKKETIYLFTVSKLIDLYRLNLCQTGEDLIEVADKYNVSSEKQEIDHAMELIKYLKKYNQSTAKEKMLDFIDMIYLPATLIDIKDFPKYDNILVDECQDLNDVQWLMIQKLFKKRSRFVCVGDPFQAIYSFMGANKDVFSKIKSYPKTTTLPLSYSYRCGTAIVAEANKIFDFIESPEGQHKGEVVYDGDLSDVQQGDYILCRNNLPLIETFLELLKNKKKASIMGKDYGKGLLSILNKMEDFSEESTKKLLTDKIEVLKSKGIRNPIKNQSYQDLSEKITILNILHQTFNSLHELKSTIENMFSDKESKDGIVLSSIHKSKGLEANNVYIIGFDELIPSKYAETALEMEQENCLKYVAITRAIQKLTFVSLNNISIQPKKIEVKKEMSRNEFWADR